MNNNLRRSIALTILLLVIASASLACQATAKLGKSGPEVGNVAEAAAAAPTATVTLTPVATNHAVAPTVAPVPTATPRPTVSIAPSAPAPLGTPGTPRAEMDEAARLIPIPQASVPKGPRKPPPARLIIPSVGIDTKVIELGTHYNDAGEVVWDTAPFAAGHHTGTANPGEPGNVVLSGHISSPREGQVFNALPEIKVGDGIVVGTKDRDYVYQVVTRQIVEPTQVDVMNSTDEETLTIITCFPDRIYSHRLVVMARRV
ncbi:MAG: sortase [Bacteroidetes bacterium]|nr:sortase [Bacteroidota bacterium]